MLEPFFNIERKDYEVNQNKLSSSILDKLQVKESC
jgi:hypothetical protein